MTSPSGGVLPSSPASRGLEKTRTAGNRKVRVGWGLLRRVEGFGGLVPGRRPGAQALTVGPWHDVHIRDRGSGFRGQSPRPRLGSPATQCGMENAEFGPPNHISSSSSNSGAGGASGAIPCYGRGLCSATRGGRSRVAQRCGTFVFRTCRPERRRQRRSAGAQTNRDGTGIAHS